jgi:hypothetical protein
LPVVLTLLLLLPTTLVGAVGVVVLLVDRSDVIKGVSVRNRSDPLVYSSLEVSISYLLAFKNHQLRLVLLGQQMFYVSWPGIG